MEDRKITHFMGIDSGSSAAKIIILDDDKVINRTVVTTGASSLKSTEKAMKIALAESQLRDEDIQYRISTGYGRRSVAGMDEQITEISCQAKGVKWLFPDAGMVIDIGGQDLKAIKLNQNGSVNEFRMNDKCAAGTGRFLEVMAKVMEMDLDHFSTIALGARNPVQITSVCTVFAESEVIGHVSSGTPVEDLVYGIFDAVATRIYILAKNLMEGVNEVVLTGGVAQNTGMVKVLEKKLGRSLLIPEYPQFSCALGAALYAREHVGQK